MKKIIISLAVLLALSAIGIFAGSNYLNKLLSIENIKTESARIFGSPVIVATQPKWFLFPPKLEISSLRWSGQQNDSTLDISIPAAEITLKLWPLFQGDLMISEVSLTSPDIKIDIVPESRKHSGTIKKTLPDSHKSAQVLNIEKLISKNGKMRLRTKNDIFELNNINLSIDHIQAHQEADIKCDFTLEEPTMLTGNIAIKTKARYYAPNLTLRGASLSFTEIKQSASTPTINLSLDGALNTENLEWKILNSVFSADKYHLSLAGEGSFSTLSFTGNTSIEYDSPLKNNKALLVAESPVIWKNSELNFPDIAIKYGESGGQGNLRIKWPANARSFMVNGIFNMGNITIPSDSDISFQENRKSNIPDQKTAIKVPEPITIFPETRIINKISSISWRDLRFENISFQFFGKNGLYQLEPIEFDWAGGKAKGGLKIDMDKSQPENKNLDFQFHAEKLNMGLALGQMGFSGISGGEATLSAHLSAAGRTLKEIFASISGNAQLNGRDATIRIFKEISSSLPLLHDSKFSIPETVDSLSAKCAANKGIFYCRPILAEAGKISCDGFANIDLSNNRIEGISTIKAFGANLPFNFQGTLDNISWHTGQGFIKELGKLFK